MIDIFQARHRTSIDKPGTYAIECDCGHIWKCTDEGEFFRCDECGITETCEKVIDRYFDRHQVLNGRR